MDGATQVLGGDQGGDELRHAQVGGAEGQDRAVAPGKVRHGLAGGDAVVGLVGVEAERALRAVGAAAGLDDDPESRGDHLLQVDSGLELDDAGHLPRLVHPPAEGVGEGRAPAAQVGTAGQEDGDGGLLRACRAGDVGAQDDAVGHDGLKGLKDDRCGGLRHDCSVVVVRWS